MKTTITILLLLGAPGPALAQADSLFAEAMRLATEGQGDSARALVRAELARAEPADSAYPGLLFAAGAVAEVLDSSLTYFRQVSIEYAGSEWADDALLRLAQLAFAAGEYASASRSAERVLMDYPLSGVRAAAGYWGGRAAFELGDVDTGCRLLTTAREEAVEDVELQNRIGYIAQRCTVATGDTAQPAPATRRYYTVQVAAVRDAAAADALMRRLAADGFESTVVRTADGWFKVRVGRYDRRQAAAAIVADLRRIAGGQPFVVEEQP